MLLCSFPGVRVKRSVVAVVLVNTPATYEETVVVGVGTTLPVRPDTVSVCTVVREVDATTRVGVSDTVSVGFPTVETSKNSKKHSVKLKRTQ